MGIALELVMAGADVDFARRSPPHTAFEVILEEQALSLPPALCPQDYQGWDVPLS